VGIDCFVQPRRPGPFEGQIHLFIADDGVREIVVSVRGEARSLEGDPG
jgi:hypothetical protein